MSWPATRKCMRTRWSAIRVPRTSRSRPSSSTNCCPSWTGSARSSGSIQTSAPTGPPARQTSRRAALTVPTDPVRTLPAALAALDAYGKCARDIYVVLAKNYLSMLAEDYEYELVKAHVADFPEFTGLDADTAVAGIQGDFRFRCIAGGSPGGCREGKYRRIRPRSPRLSVSRAQ